MHIPTLKSLRPRDRWQQFRLVVCLDLLATFVLYACVVPPPVPEGWQVTHGPVVPHDTFPADCSLCHTTGSWTEMRADFVYDHGKESGVELFGAHAEAECLRCHNDRGPVQVFAARGCAGCHEDFHQGALGRECEVCHSESDWKPHGIVAEHAGTRFPLVGAHAVTACQECHPGSEAGVFSPTPTRCESCHQADLQSTSDPNHLALGWVADCARCHKPTTWQGEGFVHSAFPLTGAHAVADCQDCHVGGVFLGTPRDCWSCHASEYQGTTDPNHVAGNFPQNCEICHSTSSWEGASFSHAGITAGCVDCHLPEYQGTSDPNHAASGFPLTCELCHQTNSWDVENFSHPGITGNCSDCHLPEYQATTEPNHAATGLPITCELCHQVTQWEISNFAHPGIVDNCVACHLPEYQSAQNPNHVGFGFPLDCESCHVSTNNWNNTNFQHTFIITSGPHAFVPCSFCHVGGVPAPADCLQCHLQVPTGQEHVGVPGYVWSNPACVSCHPTGLK